MAISSFLQIRNLTKSFGEVCVLNGVSFELNHGEVVGLLGPNGAGKTTSLRILVDILKPDSGEVVHAFVSDLALKDHIGYLPEERGLYKRIRILDLLTYLGSLKGKPADHVRQRAWELLEEIEMSDHAYHRAEQLSKGMQQKIQMISCLVHDPEVVLLDEPFSGLDPLSIKLVKDLILRLKSQGKAVLLSTHLMNQVEDLCDRILLLHHGSLVLEGPVNEVRNRFSDNSLLISLDAPWEGWDQLRGVSILSQRDNEVRLALDVGTQPGEILTQLLERHLVPLYFERHRPPLEEIFVQVVGGPDSVTGAESRTAGDRSPAGCSS